MILFSAVYNLPVNSLREGQTVGQVAEALINPDSGRVLGFKLAKTSVKNRHILSVVDIRGIDPTMILIDDSQVLATEAEVIKISEILARKIKWLGLRVETDLGRNLGKLEDFAFDLQNFSVTRIYASGGILRETFTTEGMIIPADKIIEVTPKKIIVEDGYLLLKKGREKLAQEIA